MKIAPSTARVYIYNVNPVSRGGNFYKPIPQNRQFTVAYDPNKKFHLRNMNKGAGAEKRKGIARAIWYDEEEKKYKVAENYIAFLLTKSKTFRELRDNKDNEKWLRDHYGQYADRTIKRRMDE